MIGYGIYKTYKLDVSDAIFSLSPGNLRELEWVLDYFISRLIQRRLYE